MDRLIQQAIAQAFTPQYEAVFSDRSHGFRPGRSAHHAIGRMHEEALPKGKKCHVVDCDLQAFFDTVDHQKLMGKLRESIADPRVLKLILKYLKAGVILRNGNLEATDMGVPQGGPLGPLLANILLDEPDHELVKRGHLFVRYADNFVILCSSPRAGQRILTSIKSYLKKSLKLIVNESKSKVVALQEATFLGFNIVRKKIRWTEKSQKKFKAEVRRLTQRARGHSPVKVIPKGADPRRPAILPSRSGELLCDWDSVSRYPRTQSMAASSHEALLLETVGKTSHASTQTPAIGHRKRRGPQGESRQERPLADEPNELGPMGHEQ